MKKKQKGDDVLTGNSISKDAAEQALLKHQDQGLYDALTTIGQLMVSEAQAHTTAIETTVLSVLGWTSAVLALTLSADFAGSLLQSRLVAGLAIAAVIAAVVGVAAAIVCVKTATWSIVSPDDWFRTDLFADLKRLRAYHLMALFENYQNSRGILKAKGRALAVAQWGLILATITLAAILLVRIVSVLAPPDVVRPPGG